MGDLVAGQALLADGTADVIDQLRGVQRGIEDLADGALDIGRHRHAFVDLGHALLHADHRLAGALLDPCDHAGDFLGGSAGAPRQAADLIGHHGKTASLLAGAGGFDGGVECQQVGLVSNALDHLDDVENPLGLLVQRADHLRRLLRRTRNAIHVADHLMDHPAAVLGQGFCLIGHVQRPFGMPGDFLDARGHFAGGRGHGAGRRALLLAAAGHLMAAVAQQFAHAADAVGVAAHDLDHAAQIPLHGCQATNQGAGFVLVGGLDNRLAEVAMGDALGNAAGGLQRAHDAQDRRTPQGQQQQQAGDQHAAEGQVGVADGKRGALAGLLCVAFDQLAEGLHLVFQLAEGVVERAQFLLRGFRVFQGQPDDTLGSADVGVEAGLDLVQAGLDGVVDRQLEVFPEHFAKALGVLFDGTAHLGFAAGALVQAHQHGRQHVGAQRVVHHVGFEVIAQRGHADVVVAHGLGHPGVPQVTDQAHDQRSQ
ncbi:hypothetical protein D3C80_905630 [compost metagenome]